MFKKCFVAGMHMDVTYDNQTPTWYYYEPRGNFGFISEGGGGGSISVAETVRRILPTQTKGQYIKITPSGLLGISPAVGMRNTLNSGGVSGQSVSGISEAAASTAVTIAAVEVYVFHKSAFFTVEGSGKVEAGEKTFCSACYVNKRVVNASEDNTITFKCIVPEGGLISNIKILRDNVDISSSIAPDGTVTLADVNKDTNITVTFN